MTAPIDVVKRYYAAFDTHDFDAARALMRDDFHFVGPMMEAHSPDELFAKMSQVDCEFKNRIIHIAGNGDTIGVLLECAFTRPFTATLTMSEWLTVRDGKIASTTLLYDTRQMPAPAES